MRSHKVLIIEHQPIYAASLLAQFERWNFGAVEVVPRTEEASKVIARLQPTLIVANVALASARRYGKGLAQSFPRASPTATSRTGVNLRSYSGSTVTCNCRVRWQPYRRK